MKEYSNMVPAWSVGAWVYQNGKPSGPGSLASFASTMWAYGFDMIYPYGTDLEMVSSGCTKTDGLDGAVPDFSSLRSPPLNFPYISPIIDGRIDDGGCLSGMNAMSLTEATGLATSVATGVAASVNPTQGGIQGVQFDLEPFDSSQQGQVNFYTQVAADLANKSQFFSIFIYPNQLTEATAGMLSNNGYAIISLYDITDGVPDSCTQENRLDPIACSISTVPLPVTAKGVYDTMIPHSSAGYLAAATVAVEQTIALAKQYGIKYKFAIPGGPSVHEFVQWGDYNGGNLKPRTAYSGGAKTQQEYIDAAFAAIKAGIANQQAAGNYDTSLFVGIDVWVFIETATFTPARHSQYVVYTTTEAGISYPSSGPNSNLSSIPTYIASLKP